MNIQGFTPSMSAAVQSPVSMASTPKANAASDSGSGSNGTDASSLQSTFLNLLITELQNQDPTQPVDPTAMVGQMVSLNQLDQLISINQTLSGLASGSGTDTSNTSSDSANKKVAADENQAATTPPNAAAMQRPTSFSAQAAMPMSAASDGGLMNLYGGFAMPAAHTNLTYKGAN